MKITSLSLKDFRCFEEASLEFTEPVTVIVGPNHTGKSTMLDAIAWAMTGICRGTDAGGRGSEDLVRAGSEPSGMEVTLGVGKSSFTRKIGDGARSKLSTTIASKHGIRPDAALVCLAWGSFIEMEPAAAYRALMQVLDIYPPYAIIKEMAGADYEEIAQLKFQSAEDLKAAYDWVYKCRADAARDIKTYGGINLPDLSVYPPDLQAQTVKEATELRSACRDQLKDLNTQLEALVAKAAVTKAGGRAATEARIASVKNEIKEQEEIARKLGPSLDLGPLEKALKDALQRNESAAGRLKTLEDALRPAQASQVALRRQLDALGSKMEGDKAPCPTCRRPLTAEAWKQIHAKVGIEIENIEAEVLKLNQSLEEVRIEAKKSDPMVYTKALDTAHDNLKRRESDLTSAHTKIHNLQGQLAKLVKEVMSIPVESEQPELVEQEPEPQEVIDLREYIVKGSAYVNRLTYYISERGQHDVQGKQLVEAKEHYGRLDRLCTLLGPKGPVATKCIGTKLDEFTGAINEAIGAFNYRAMIEVEPTFAIKVASLGTGQWIPLKLLSSSEKLRLGLAVQVAFAKASGFGLIVADEVSILDAEGKGNLFGLVENALEDGVQQVIIAATIPTPMGEFVTPQLKGWDYVVMD